MLYAKVFDMEGLHKMMFGLEESKNSPWAYTGFQAFGFGFVAQSELSKYEQELCDAFGLLNSGPNNRNS